MNYSEVRGQGPGLRERITPCHSFLAALFCWVGVGGMMTQPIQADDSHRQTILFLADEGPLVIEFQITVDEKPFAEVWESELAKLVKELDRDENGLLSRAETEINPKQKSDKTSKPSLAAVELLQVANLWDADAEPRDDQLSLEEIRRFLSRQGEGPFQSKASKKTAALMSPPLTLVTNSSARLWKWLDTNDDGRLSVEELQTARVSLKKHDLDADEAISLVELEGEQNPFFSAQNSNQANAETPFFSLNGQQSTTLIIRGLIKRYEKKETPEMETSKDEPEKGSKAPKPPEPSGVAVELWKLTPSQRQRFDRDGNGVLDPWELRAYLKNPVPMVKIQVHMPSSETAVLDLSGSVTETKLPVAVKNSAGGAISILAGEIQIEIDVSGLKPESLLQSLEERFKLRDINNNGYLEQTEANRDVFFREHFKKYDADGDEKLYPKEWKPPVVAAIQTAKVRTRMEVQDGGKDVFSVLDMDRNMQISPREWLTVADRLSVWDKNENHTLEQTEIPHVYRLSFGRGLPDLPGLITVQNNNQPLTMSQLVRGPKWFQAMDKNGDGDVSAGEFLGKPEVFERIDQDKNRLIDSREATKFSK